MEPFPGGNQLEAAAAAAQRRIMDAGVDPAMQHLHSYPPENFSGENQEFFYKPIHIPQWISMKLWIYIV